MNLPAIKGIAKREVESRKGGETSDIGVLYRTSDPVFQRLRRFVFGEPAIEKGAEGFFFG